jgi:pimeloyl-ACP methyl ester carboxylesterase
MKFRKRGVGNMLKYSISGNLSGQLIIFINGAGMGPWMWKNQIEYFKDKKCIVFDLPGHGENKDIEFISIKNCQELVSQIVLNESESKEAVVIGHSIGAQILMSMLEHNQEIVSKGIIISGLNEQMKFVNFMLKPLVSVSMPLVKLRWFAKIQSNQLSIPNHMFDDYYNDSIKVSRETLYKVLYENSNFVFENRSNFTKPVLILVGENEKRVMKKSARKNLMLLEKGIGYTIKNSAHGIPYESDSLANRIIENFINDKSIEEHKEILEIIKE